MSIETASVAAEDAPIGVQLWPTTSPVYAPNYTLREVVTIRTGAGAIVRWTCQSGKQRTFTLGEQVAVDAQAVTR